MSLRMVLLISQRDTGGAQTALNRLRHELLRRGHAVELWFLYDRSGTAPDALAGDILLDRPAPGALGYLRIMAMLAARLRRVRPDCVVSFLPLANVLGQSLALLAGIHSRIASQRNPQHTYDPLLRGLDWVVGSLGVYTAIVVNSASVADACAHYPRAYRQRLRVVYNGAVPDQQRRTDPAAARAALGLPADAFLLGNPGRLHPQKNQAVLVAALAALPCPVHLAIAGDGPLAAPLREQADSLGVTARLHLLGRVPPDVMPTFFRAVDLVCMPSVYEGHSNALLEAMAAGVPVLTSNIASFRETLAQSAGPMLEATDTAGWAAAIAHLQHAPEQRAALAERGRQRVAAFTVEAMADGFLAAVERSPV